MKSLTQSINESLEILENALSDIFGDNPLKKGSKEVVDVEVDGKPATAINYIFDYWSDSTVEDIQMWMSETSGKNIKNCVFDSDDLADEFEDNYDAELGDDLFIVCWYEDGNMFAVPYDKSHVKVK